MNKANLQLSPESVNPDEARLLPLVTPFSCTTPNCMPITADLPSEGVNLAAGLDEGAGDAGGEAAGAPASLSITEDNSNGEGEKKGRALRYGEVKKKVYALKVEVREFLRRYDPVNCGFFTLTVSDDLHNKKDFEKVLNSAFTGFLRGMFGGRYIIVRERQEKRGRKNGNAGAWHIHCLVYCGGDVTTGSRWNTVKGRLVCDRPNSFLLKLRLAIRDKKGKYKSFGRYDLSPLKGAIENAAGYVCKYISKGLKYTGDRLVSFGRKVPRAVMGRHTLLNESRAQWAYMCAVVYQDQGRRGVGWSVLESAAANGRMVRTSFGQLVRGVVEVSQGEFLVQLIMLAGKRAMKPWDLLLELFGECQHRHMDETFGFCSDLYVAPSLFVHVPDVGWCKRWGFCDSPYSLDEAVSGV